MNNAQWLKEMQCLYSVQSRPAWVPRLFWLSTQQRSNILSELLLPQTKK